MSRTITGIVHSDKGDKTIVVRTAVTKTHPLYRKQYKRNRKFMAHDEKNEARIGDLVVIKETRPLSAKKHFALEKIIEKATAGYKETDAEADIQVEMKEETLKVNKPSKSIASKPPEKTSKEVKS